MKLKIRKSLIILLLLIQVFIGIDISGGGSLDNAKVVFDVTSGTPAGAGLFIFDVPEAGGTFDNAAAFEPTGDYTIYEDGQVSGASGFVYPHIETLNYVLIVLHNDQDDFSDITVNLQCIDSGSSDYYSTEYGDSLSGDLIWAIFEVEFDDESPVCNLVASLTYAQYDSSSNPTVDTAKYSQTSWNTFNTIILNNFVDDVSYPWQVMENLESHSFDNPYY